MKRNLLLLAVMVTALFGFYSLSAAQCPQDPNDNGICDTIYVEAWCADTVYWGPAPTVQYVHVPILVTHDVPNAAIDSIAAFVIPLCVTSSNAAANAVLLASENTTNLYPFPNLDKSIFRHLNCPPLMSNWMMTLSESLTGLDWDTRILDLTGGLHFWMALFPTGSADQRFGAGSRVLLASMKFQLEDSTMLCIDSCFWPPASRLTFSRSDAVTYIPRHSLPFCHDFYTPPNLLPYFDGTCGGGVEDPQNRTQNGNYTTDIFCVTDDDGTIASVVASPASLPGVANITATLNKADSRTGTVNYDVVDHCLAGGTVTLTVTDDLGGTNAVAETFNITLGNTPPTVNAGGDKSGAYNVQLCSDVVVTGDVDGDVVTWAFTVAPAPSGTFSKVGDRVCFDADCNDVGVAYTVTVTATDACGATATDNVNFSVTNAGPSITCPASQSVSRGDLFSSTDFSGNDPEGEALGFSVVGIVPAATFTPQIVGGTLQWQTDNADALGDYVITLMATDQCGLTATCDFTLTLVFKQDFIEIGNYECANPGEYVSLPVYLINNTVDIGGFELEFEFDYTSMCFVDAEPGDCLDTEGWYDQDDNFHSWEYFTYRLLPCQIPPCIKYKVLVYGQAEIPNGHQNIGECIPAGQNCVLVYLNFVVMNNQNLRGFKIPVCFEWEGTVVDDIIVEDWECTENTLSSCDGNTLYTSSLLCEFNPDVCDDPGGDIQGIFTFQQPICGLNCGGVGVCAAGPETCKRGDVNMNTVAYEVADAVLFANYFVYGTGVFIHDMDYQICATDANGDGRTLTLSDMIYLIRVILHDAVEVPKLAPSSEVANVIVYNNTITTECAAPIAAMLFEFDGAVEATMLANMEMIHNGSKVLVWSRNGNSFTTAEVLSFAGAELVSVSAVDYDTREVQTSITAKVAPTAFALNPAYPNPFNPFTNISFVLPEPMNYSLKIYNVAGQLVRGYDGVGSSNLNVITWDGKDNAGSEVSSGVYFFKLIAGGFSATEKMVMMK